MRLFYLPGIIIFLISCAEPVVEVASSSNQLDTKTIEYLVAQGFPRNEIKLVDGKIVVGGDATVSIEALPSDSHKGKTNQWHANYIASPIKAGYVVVAIDRSVKQRWIDALDEAILEWNKLNGTFNKDGNSIVYFARTTSLKGDIIVSQDTLLTPGLLAFSSYPDTKGFVGPKIRISTDDSAGSLLTKSELRGTMMHELGHCLGLRHSDWYYTGESLYPYGVVPVPGSPWRDDYSIMNALKANGVIQSSFSEADTFTINNLWPYPH